GLAGQAEAESATDALTHGVLRFGIRKPQSVIRNHAARQPTRQFEERLVVKYGKGLQGRVRADATRARTGRVRGVEDGQRRVRGRALEERIDPAAVAIRPGAGPPRP